MNRSILLNENDIQLVILLNEDDIQLVIHSLLLKNNKVTLSTHSMAIIITSTFQALSHKIKTVAVIMLL